jgi:GTPase
MDDLYTRDFEELADEIEDFLSMNPEVEEGNREYKLKLTKDERLRTLESQMCWRLKEGGGEAFYFLGIADDGSFRGLSPEEDATSISNLKIICNRIDVTSTLIQEKWIDGKVGRKFLIRENNNLEYINLRVGVLGQVDAGKSTLVGVLVSGGLDNGRGTARGPIFNFKHERETGRTSSVAQRIIGFTPGGSIVNVDDSLREKSWKEIVDKSSKVVTFFDLCGHNDYLHTTIGGISSNQCDYGLILVSASDGITRGGTTLEHVSICLTFRIPMAIIVTKYDQVVDKPEVYKDTVDTIIKVIKSIKGKKRILKSIDSRGDLIDCLDGFQEGTIVPMITCSSVTGKGIDLIKSFLNLAKPRLTFDDKGTVRLNVIEIFKVEGTGLVIGGFLMRGTIRIGDTYLLGPDRNGKFDKCRVRTIEVKRVRVEYVTAGMYVCLGCPKFPRERVRRGMIITSDKDVKPVRSFDANVVIREKKSVTIRPGYESMVNIGPFKSNARVRLIRDYQEDSFRHSSEKIGTLDNPVVTSLRVGDRANVRFDLTSRPCYIENGERMVFTNGTMTIVGVVTEVYDEKY